MTFLTFSRQKLYQSIALLLFITSPMLWAQTIVILADTPYSEQEKQLLQGPTGTLYRLINKANPTVVMHLGDFKNGGESCTDALLTEHKALLGQVYPGKMIYTPGDNDWTDCDRSSLLYRFDELERLNFLIKLMYQTSPLLDENLRLISSQTEQIENKLWLNDRLAISTLHLVGTSNGRTDINQSKREDAINKADQRDQSNFAWLKNIENKAKDFDALIIGFQADIYQGAVLKSGLCDDSALIPCDAFTVYRQVFKDLAKRLNKPILISHGDTGAFCFEQLGHNLWHLNAAGDFRYLDAATVTYNKHSPKQPFTVNGLINTDLPTMGCKN